MLIAQLRKKNQQLEAEKAELEGSAEDGWASYAAATNRTIELEARIKSTLQMIADCRDAIQKLPADRSYADTCLNGIRIELCGEGK